METDLVSLLFDSITTSLQSFISNDISVMLLGMLSVSFVLFAFVKIQEFFDIGLSNEEKLVKSAYGRWQSNKGTWREQIAKEEYQQRMNQYRTQVLVDSIEVDDDE